GNIHYPGAGSLVVIPVFINTLASKNHFVSALLANRRELQTTTTVNQAPCNKSISETSISCACTEYSSAQALLQQCVFIAFGTSGFLAFRFLSALTRHINIITLKPSLALIDNVDAI